MKYNPDSFLQRPSQFRTSTPQSNPLPTPTTKTTTKYDPKHDSTTASPKPAHLQ